MDFHLEERRAWVRTSTHTVILDRDPEFVRFAANPSGMVARLIRVWENDASGSDRSAYLGATCLGPGGYRRQDLARIYRRLANRESRGELKALLRETAFHSVPDAQWKETLDSVSDSKWKEQ
jgi:hypothetical protein